MQKRNISHYKALPSYITIEKSKIHGLGLFATSDIKEGLDLGLSHVLNDKYKDGLIRTPLGAFINHSSNPNSDLIENDDNVRLITLRKIKKGEELTVDYHGWYNDEIVDAFKQ